MLSRNVSGRYRLVGIYSTVTYILFLRKTNLSTNQVSQFLMPLPSTAELPPSVTDC